jgi:hypothetical protein
MVLHGVIRCSFKIDATIEKAPLGHFIQGLPQAGANSFLKFCFDIGCYHSL